MFLPMLLTALLLVHFLNIYLQWTVIRHELENGPAFHSPEYTFIGLSLFHRKEIEAIHRLPNAARHGRIYGYFDLFHPAVFLIWNNGQGEDFFDLGQVIVSVPAGFSRVSFLPGSVFRLQHGEKTVVRHCGGAMVGLPWQNFLRKETAGSDRKANGASGSFVVKEVEKSRYLKIPFLIYFFVPFFLIVFMVATSGAGMAAAFFYYAGMFFLFDFQRLFVTVPLAWLFNALGVELSDLRVTVVAVCLAVFFLATAVWGLWRWKNREMSRRDKWIVCFFILLPFFLFF